MNKMTPKRTILAVVMLLLLALGITLVQPKQADAQITYTPGPKVVYSMLHTNLTGSLATQNLPAMPAGVYRVSFIQWVTTVGSAGSCQGTTNWQTEGGNAGGNIGGSLNLTIVTVPREQTMILRNKAGGVMAYASSCTGITGSPIFQLWVMVEKLS
jgi:hypothetical protein